ncbi:MAG: bile acid:sodium symporter [Planctomycetota bacterium]|nr:bile acid:sodium symporter [Planctomycetota bacterium]
MQNFLKQHWFLTTLALLIVSGLSIGLTEAGPTVKQYSDHLDPRWVTAGVLLLMSFSLDSGKLWAAFKAPGPVLLGFLLNYGLVPVVAWLLMPLQQMADFRYGLMVAATVPCTTAAASVMTRKAGGNDAISLLTTLSTNLSCFVLTPLWLRGTTGASAEYDTWKLVSDLIQAVLVPTLIGQGLRLIPSPKAFANRYKTQISIAAQVLIEVMVFSAALKAGMTLYTMNQPITPPADSGAVSADPRAATPPATQDLADGDDGKMASDESNAPAGSDSDAVVLQQPAVPAASPGEKVTPQALLVALASCAGTHLLVLVVGWYASRALGFTDGEAAAVAFSGSQKTLPIGLYIATATFGATYPFAMFPMLLYHTSQLFLDTAIASRLAARENPAPPAPPPLSG